MILCMDANVIPGFQEWIAETLLVPTNAITTGNVYTASACARKDSLDLIAAP